MNFKHLKNNFSGQLFDDNLHRSIYSTDASVYQEKPKLVACPKNEADLKQLIQYATDHKLSLVSRLAGTSLAGQCISSDIVVDIGRYFNKIININVNQKTALLQPGVILDDFNMHIKKHELFFGLNTSTSNRCMIGGMVGNNSSGTTSIKYGVTRDKVISLKCILSDAKTVEFKPLNYKICLKKSKQNDVEGKIYKDILNFLKDKDYQKHILKYFPKPEIHRRNTGYAIDELVKYYNQTGYINLSKLICGSEGTLCFITEIKIQLDSLPPQHSSMIVAHFHSVDDCLKAVSVTMQDDLFTCEMMDDTIMDCTKNHSEFKHYRFFLTANPKAILFLEIRSNDKQNLEKQTSNLLDDLKQNTSSYAFPVLKDEEIKKAFKLRKAGLGLLGSMIGDKKTVACIEDTAVALKDLQPYIKEFSGLMKKYNQKPVYYAHAGAGELHLRPILNLKDKKDVEDFKSITHDVAILVKSYKGSLSGEHGDGIVRSDFIKLMLGEECYKFLTQLKFSFDPHQIFNADKIIKTSHNFSIDKKLRYQSKGVLHKSFLNFSAEKSLLHATENCNGSGDCRKTELSSGGMCPSYHATKNEKDTTRARANALRQYLTDPKTLSDQAIKEVFDLCISCKACKRECPSNVDLASFKAEWTYQYYKTHKRPIRDKLIGFNDSINKLLQPGAGVYNYFVQHKFWSKTLKKPLGFHQNRSLPQLSQQLFFNYLKKNKVESKSKTPKIQTIYLFVDEFTNRLESETGRDAVELLTQLGYEVKYLKNKPSGRALISKGFLKQAKVLAEYNIDLYKDIINEQTPLLGIEPSAILGFRDDYLRLVDDIKVAEKLSKNVFLVEEFLSQEIQRGHISSNQFSEESCEVKLHIHCHQKALSNSKITFDAINIVKNAKVSIIPSGCCGMAGGFGFEKEHYNISMKIGELILLPAVRNSKPQTYILANGTSCRHQIKDGSPKRAMHPVSFLRQMLK
ncbi:FAD-binding and (Fe-S)-binding domain-containing protein [Flavobacterium sp. CS20]|uniref:FAD-binding and (Fe-S)-binding domain-containing protein n=1 Tax=Flavobacterium sp. CS20 TaxID=2775246 RepID=UPI001B3A4BF2|nr:FAD-binding and (Fe-S)-binding domain-containing protein [Flavobacterium sp. CS20]QTY27531.1 FAD-binding protein [Flavobacterium sp. CS20]